ncbi:MAG: hypothetical protein KDE05_07955 [Parvularculaceae bacterium]|nr:hypothetical protein [Parvularculaceae bacterium]
MKRLAAALILALLGACGEGREQPAVKDDASLAADADISIVGVDELAERFVKLGLNLGRFDKNYVDAYSGPPAWADDAQPSGLTLDDLEKEASEILDALDILARDGATPRETGLARNATAALTRIRMAKGAHYSFDEEARLIYGVAPPSYSLEAFDSALSDLDALAPGEGALSERVDAFRASLAIPDDKLEAVMDAAIAECRRRTIVHYDLPENERFVMRTVKDKPWSGYNWYQGDFESIIEINTDFPVTIDRAIRIGCHEGYPGHHVWNVVVDRDLRRAAGWIEFSILPLFSPQAMIGEGSANYGVELAFPDGERTTFERDVLFPLAGLDPADADRLAAIDEGLNTLAHAQNHIAREYLDGRIDREAAVELLQKYGLNSKERAGQRVDFFDTYRSYIINYTIGQDLVRAYVDARAAEGLDKWAAFEELLKSPDAAGALLPQ